MSKYLEDLQYENYFKKKEGSIEIMFDKLETKIDHILKILKLNKCCCKKTKALTREQISFVGED